jgi:5'-nucleotidase
MEGYLFGIPAIAFPQVERGWVELQAAARTVRAIVEQVLAAGPAHTPWLLNVNMPNRPDIDDAPRVVTRQGRRHASEPVIRQTNPRGEAIYWIGPAGDAREAGEGTDFHATAQGWVSVTPLQVDLTAHATLDDWRGVLVPRGARP